MLDRDLPSQGGLSVLEFRQVSKTYDAGHGRVTALKDLSISVRPGEFLTVVGPSGCGKSTLLNLLVGLEQPSGGDILLNGSRSIDRRRIGYVMQNDNLYPWRTLRENVEFPLELRNVPEAERRRISLDYLAKVHLRDFADRYPHELSGGMRQRGNIVRALSFSPDLIIMDEPFGPLDAQTRLLLQNQLLELWADEGKTVIFITHDLPEAIALGDRVMVLTARPGRVKSVHDVPIPRPRNVRHLHEDSVYRDLLSRLGDELAEEISAGGVSQ
ncbi:ABC transporter ATP-binding protein [Xanthobacter sp. KR7-65]|uniref:ABC transporter ATP-binding protein n=1 Tax=Xanthobacter sp. KR7-65 TaxID=3156612 RepID=UPI0032B56624